MHQSSATANQAVTDTSTLGRAEIVASLAGDGVLHAIVAVLAPN